MYLIEDGDLETCGEVGICAKRLKEINIVWFQIFGTITKFCYLCEGFEVSIVLMSVLLWAFC